MSNFTRCPSCGTRLYGAEVHSTATCEAEQQRQGLPPPAPLKSWPSSPRPLTDLEKLLTLAGATS